MKVLFTGDYLPNYNRTAILKKGLLSLGHEIIEYPFKKKTRKNKNEIIQLSNGCDIVFLPCFTHQQVSFVKKIVPHLPLVFDPLISRYLTKVHDYKLVSPYGLSALRNYYRDKKPMMAADLVFTDTFEHKKYFHKKFKIPMEKMKVLYIGNDFDHYYPIQVAKENNRFHIGFYGGFIPLQGVMKILEAINTLKNQEIAFTLVGNGFEYDKAKKYIKENSLNNVNLPGWLSESDLHKKINDFDLCLGIFGDGSKTDLVIPNKVYHYAACAKPIITKDTRAIREIFTDKENIFLIKGSSKSIADKIMELKDHTNLKEIGENAFKLLEENYNSTKIAEAFIKAIHLQKKGA